MLGRAEAATAWMTAEATVGGLGKARKRRGKEELEPWMSWWWRGEGVGVIRGKKEGARPTDLNGGRRLCSGQGDGWRAREEEWDVLGVHGEDPGGLK